MSNRKPSKPLNIADLFCGAGGTSTGAVEAIELLGHTARLTAINHWDVAIATHTENHPGARHLCTSIDDIDPRKLFADGELDILWASPACTHHSVARGGKPVNDQSRATAWCVVRWAESLRPSVILVENVPEFESWGAIGSDGRPLKTKKGATFLAWKGALESLGYTVDHRVLCAADYGDPTTRRRLFVQAVRGRRRIVWPEKTHSAQATSDLLSATRSWRTARDHVIDWALPGQSIYDRKRPLSEKTMRRIMAGLEKFGLKPFVVPQQTNPVPKGVDEPLGTVVAEGSGPKLVEPFILTMEHGGGIRSANRPIPTVTTAKGGAMAVVQPFLVASFGEREGQTPRTHDINQPLPTVTAQKGGPGLVTPFLVPQQTGEDRVRSVDKPLQTVTTESRGIGLAQPFLVKVAGAEDRRPRSVDEPHPTVTAGGIQMGIAQPFLVEMRGTSDQQLANTAHGLDKPVGAITAGGIHHGLAQPFLIHTAHAGERAALDTKEPLPAVAGNRGDVALIEPSLLPQQSDGALRPVSEPVPTVATAGAIGLVEPFLIEYYGNGTPNAVTDPLPTVTCNDRHALVRPVVVIDGERYLLDIRFRMLQPHELAKAQGFRDDYKFTGTKTEQVKQIGNAVPRNLARAIVLAVLSQSSDVTAYLPDENASNPVAA